jgi:hypothetical protein
VRQENAQRAAQYICRGWPQIQAKQEQVELQPTQALTDKGIVGTTSNQGLIHVEAGGSCFLLMLLSRLMIRVRI